MEKPDDFLKWGGGIEKRQETPEDGITATPTDTLSWRRRFFGIRGA